MNITTDLLGQRLPKNRSYKVFRFIWMPSFTVLICWGLGTSGHIGDLVSLHMRLYSTITISELCCERIRGFITFSWDTRSSRWATLVSRAPLLDLPLLPRGLRLRCTVLQTIPALLHAKHGLCLSHFVLRRRHCSQLNRTGGLDAADILSKLARFTQHQAPGIKIMWRLPR